MRKNDNEYETEQDINVRQKLIKRCNIKGSDIKSKYNSSW